MKDRIEKAFDIWFENNCDWLQEKCCDANSGSIYDSPAPSCHFISSGDGWNDPIIIECTHADDCPYLNRFAWDYFIDNVSEDEIDELVED